MPIPVEQLIIKIAGDAKEFNKAIADVKKTNKSAGTSFKTLGKVGAGAFLAIGAAATALGKIAFNEFKAFETGATNVAKTTNLAGEELEEFKKNIVSMSEEVPVTTEKLLEIAASAGQLGIKGVDSLTKFTKTIALLGKTTNVDGEEAALTLARLLNITGESTDSVDTLGAALVDLGNNFATTEAEILEISKDLGKATIQFGVGSTEILGMSAAMASLGVNAEAGGTVVGKAFSAIDTAVREQAGPAFDKLIELTGMTGDELTKTFKTDATSVFSSFIGGLGKAGKSGKSMSEELNAMGLSGIRVEKILPTLASRSDLLSEALKRSSKAAKENTALNNEAAKAFETNAAKWQIAQNKINNAFIELGAEIAPEVTKAFESIADTIRENKGAISVLGSAINITIKAISVTLSTFGAIIGAAKDAAVYDVQVIVGAWLALNTAINSVVGSISKTISGWVDSIKKKIEPISSFIKKLIPSFTLFGKSVEKSSKKTEKAVKKSSESIIDKIKKQIKAFRDSGKDWMETDKDITKSTEKRKKKVIKTIKDETKEKIKEEKKQIDAVKAAEDEKAKEKAAALKEREKAEKESSDRIQAEMMLGFKAEQDALDEHNKIDHEKRLLKLKARKDQEKAANDAMIADQMALGVAMQAELDKQAEIRKNNAQGITSVEASELLKRRQESADSLTNEELLYVKYHGKALIDEKNYGDAIVALKVLQGTAEYGAVKGATSELASLINSENSRMKEVGKAATMVQIGISTAESAMKAFASLAWIPYVGPVLGGVASAAIITYGAEQISNVQGMKTGGIVPGIGGQGIGDKVPTMLEPGELVIPRRETQELLKNIDPRGMADGGKVAGAEESKNQWQTFNEIFMVPGIFKAILGMSGGDGDTTASGFGAEDMVGVPGAIMGALEDAADKLLEEFLSAFPGGEYIYKAMKMLDIPMDKLKEMLGDSSVAEFLDDIDLSDELVDTASGIWGSAYGAAEGLASAGGDLIKGIGSALGFQDGGVVGMTSPGEMRLSKDALQSIAGGVNMGQTNGVQTQKIIKNSSGLANQRQAVGVEIYLNQNASEVINAQLREGQNLGTIIPI